MSTIQRTLTLAAIVLVTLLAAVSATAAEYVSVNGVPVDPGATTVRIGDVIAIENHTPFELRVRLAERTIVITPRTKRTFAVGSGSKAPLTITGPGGRWNFALRQGNSPFETR